MEAVSPFERAQIDAWLVNPTAPYWNLESLALMVGKLLRPGSAPAEEREELAVMTIGEVKKLVTHAMAVYAEGIGRAMAKMGLFQFTAEALLREAHEQGEAFDRGEWALSEGTRRLINSDGVGALVDASGFSRSRQQEQQQAKEGEV